VAEQRDDDTGTETRWPREWLETVSDLTRRLLSGEDPDDALAAFAQRVRRFTAADLVLVAVAETVPDPEAGTDHGGHRHAHGHGRSPAAPTPAAAAERVGMLIVAADGDGAGRLRGTVLGVGDTLIGHVYTSGRAMTVADIRRNTHADREATAAFDLGPAIVVPLAAADQPRGALSVARHAGAETFDDDLAELIADLAVQAAVVLELADRRRDSELLSQYAARDRMGRDLHDLAIQRMFATSISLQGACKITADPAVAHRIAAAVSDLDETVKVIRSKVFSQHPRDHHHSNPH
jgi:signal transduction histidine kinase